MAKFTQVRVNGAVRRTDNPPPGSSGVLIRWALTDEQAAAYLKKVDMRQYAEAYGKELTIDDFRSISGVIWAQGWLTTSAARATRDAAFPVLCDIDARLTNVSEARLTNREGLDFSRFTFDFSVDAVHNMKPFDAAVDAADGTLPIRVRQPRLNQGARSIGSTMLDPVATANAVRAGQVLSGTQGSVAGF
jgi:hypothetical protein